MTPLKEYSKDKAPARGARKRGPVFASRQGVIGVEYGCGHFVPGPISGEAGARVKDTLVRMSRCPVCFPGGAHFHKEMLDLAVLPEPAI